VKIILLGPPGAGKGTQAELLRDRLNIPHIATGDMLREAIRRGDAFGKSIQATIDSGHFAPDDDMIRLVKERIAKPDCKNGFILDGFPRTPAQAQALENAGVELDYVVQITVPDEVIVSRLAGRRVHPASGRTYHIVSHPPKRDGVDNETGEALIMRPDDSPETVRERLRVYHRDTEPMVHQYRNKQNGMHFVTVDGTKNEEEVFEEIREQIFPKQKQSRL
jgi:adenylate kinase